VVHHWCKQHPATSVDLHLRAVAHRFITDTGTRANYSIRITTLVGIDEDNRAMLLNTIVNKGGHVNNSRLLDYLYVRHYVGFHVFARVPQA